MQLGKLLDGIAVSDFRGNSEIEIKGLAYDSRSVKPGYLFVALKGQAENGHDFVKNALQNGAVALVLEQSGWTDTKAAIVQVSNSREALSRLAVNFYNRPFTGMTLIGITGTNGKTTSSYVLESILSVAGAVPGVIGTINYRFSGQSLEAPVTTPESLDLMSILRKMADGGVTDVVMEVSSHSLHQGRVRGCPFHVGVFTNISRDHLDYHNSMEDYFAAKSLLFRGIGKKKPHHLTWAIINADDPKGEELLRLTEANVVTYGLEKDRDVRAEGVELTRNGMTASLVTPAGKIDIHSSLIGDFNIYNILAASAAALCLGIDLNGVASGIARLEGVPGRLELVKNRQSLAIVVDYAHTPDALLKAIRSVRPLTEGRLITVFGCGGDRDKGKRREMGRVAGEHSDLAFVTSDNPRTEDPAAIAVQIEEGVHESGLKKLEGAPDEDLAGPGYILELDRGKAIQSAIGLAHESDLILIAGKGHEDYQVIGKEKRHFDDREVAAQAVRNLASVHPEMR
jgi:UDP-N-acetylmuramoyl-L-alanyl-D-glutamate--2,6-diaminopimelate ligase